MYFLLEFKYPYFWQEGYSILLPEFGIDKILLLPLILDQKLIKIKSINPKNSATDFDICFL